MGLRNAIFGRSTPATPQLDHLFALPTASMTLRTQLDLAPSGQAGLCYKAGSGESSLSTTSDLRSLLGAADDDATYELTSDDLGFSWLIVNDPTMDGLVTKIHGANTTLVDHGLGSRLLCAVFGFVPASPPGEGVVKMVYLLQQGTFYPFAPVGENDRNNELELRVRSFLGSDLAIEKDLSRWMALWGVPVR